MEPNVQKELTYLDLSFAESAFSFWSKKSMQGLLESGLVHDFAKAVSDDGFDMNKACKSIRSLNYLGSVNNRDVSLSQAVKVMSIAPKDTAMEWRNFFDLIITISANSMYFEDKIFSWVECDIVRQAIGLKPINPVYKNKEDEDVILRHASHCNVWNYPDEGYRYATIDEIPIVAVEELPCFVSSIKSRYRWVRLVVVDKKIQVQELNTDNFFHQKEAYIPLIKINE